MAASLEKLIASRYGGRNLPIAVILPDGARVPLSPRPEFDVIARTFSGLKALASPAMGALARAYVRNDVDFTGSARKALAIAESMVGEIAHGRDSVGAWVRHILHQSRSNRANISHHYDGSNEFYRLFLDQRMVYSCAYFRSPEDSLDTAQANKLDHICRKLRLAPGERYLDIGCGWGALLLHAAEKYGVEAHGITLSKNQFDHVTRAGRTFRYTAEGRPQGLLKDRKVYVVASRGGIYSGDSPMKAMDFQEPYLRAMLAFIGLTDVTFIHVEGQMISAAEAEAGLQRARETLGKIVPRIRAAA